MSLGTFTKQPVEVLDYDVDFSQWLATGDSLYGSPTVTITPAWDAVTNASGLKLVSAFNNTTSYKLIFQGGVTLTSYRIEVTSTTSNGYVKQIEFTIKVKDT